MNRAHYEQRRRAGLPIVSGRELVHALQDVSRLTVERSTLWYLMNRLLLTAMAFANDEERQQQRGKKETGAKSRSGND